MTWLERDDAGAAYTRAAWRARALQRVSLLDDPIDYGFAARVDYMRSRFERIEKLQGPWADDELYTVTCNQQTTPEWYAAMLVASLTLDPPEL